MKTILEIDLRECENEDHVEFSNKNNERGRSFSVTLKELLTLNFQTLFDEIGQFTIRFLIEKCILITQTQDIFIQISGDPLHSLLNDSKAIAKQIRQNMRKANKNNRFPAMMRNLNRNGMLYCLHSNGKPGIFHKSELMNIVKFIRQNYKKSHFEESEYGTEVVKRESQLFNPNFRNTNQERMKYGRMKSTFQKKQKFNKHSFDKKISNRFQGFSDFV